MASRSRAPAEQSVARLGATAAWALVAHAVFVGVPAEGSAQVCENETFVRGLRCEPSERDATGCCPPVDCARGYRRGIECVDSERDDAGCCPAPCPANQVRRAARCQCPSTLPFWSARHGACEPEHVCAPGASWSDADQRCSCDASTPVWVRELGRCLSPPEVEARQAEAAAERARAEAAARAQSELDEATRRETERERLATTERARRERAFSEFLGPSRQRIDDCAWALDRGETTIELREGPRSSTSRGLVLVLGPPIAGTDVETCIRRALGTRLFSASPEIRQRTHVFRYGSTPEERATRMLELLGPHEHALSECFGRVPVGRARVHLTFAYGAFVEVVPVDREMARPTVACLASVLNSVRPQVSGRFDCEVDIVFGVPESLAREQIVSAMSSARAELRRCRAGSEAAAALAVRMTVSGDGRVVSIEILSSTFPESSGACVGRALRGLSFPPFTRAELTFDFDFGML